MVIHAHCPLRQSSFTAWYSNFSLRNSLEYNSGVINIYLHSIMPDRVINSVSNLWTYTVIYMWRDSRKHHVMRYNLYSRIFIIINYFFSKTRIFLDMSYILNGLSENEGKWRKICDDISGKISRHYSFVLYAETSIGIYGARFIWLYVILR